MKSIHSAVDKYEKLILDAERYIWHNPEIGYKEYKTNDYLKGEFRKLGYELTEAGGITGFYTELDTHREGPCVMIIGELDSVICNAHPESDEKTGAVHACGHNAQCAALLGIAAALTESSVTERLSGRIRLCAVPSEELLDIEYRSSLIKEGKIKYLVGKTEYLSRGYFDGVDIALMVHTSNANFIGRGANGCIAKEIVYKGRSAHAGGAPEDGINALYAANCGISAVNALRETFRDSDSVRFHPIVTSGGSIVNAIPERVCLESHIRAKSYEAMERENKKINRALTGAALSLGANIEITDTPGYAPLFCDTNMMLTAKRAFELCFPEKTLFYSDDAITGGSTDMGDLACIMPVVHPYIAGASGTTHGADYRIDDPHSACVDSAKWQLSMLTLLLENGAREALRIKEEFKPRFSGKDEYLAYVDSLRTAGERIVYNEDGSATVR